MPVDVGGVEAEGGGSLLEVANLPFDLLLSAGDLGGGDGNLGSSVLLRKPMNW